MDTLGHWRRNKQKYFDILGVTVKNYEVGSLIWKNRDVGSNTLTFLLVWGWLDISDNSQCEMLYCDMVEFQKLRSQQLKSQKLKSQKVESQKLESQQLEFQKLESSS